MNLFAIRYPKEVEKNQSMFSISLKHKDVIYEKTERFNTYRFIDAQGNEWMYTESIYRRNFEKIEIGTYYFNDNTMLTRTHTPEEVMQKAEEYFSPLSIQEEPKITLNKDIPPFSSN